MSPGPTPTARKAPRCDNGSRQAAIGSVCTGPAAAAPNEVEGLRQRRTVKTEHHDLLGCRFLTHPPICRFRVEVRDPDHPLTQGLGSSFVVEDEPYFVELQDLGSTRILLTADYGTSGAWDPVNALYGRDTSLLADQHSRVIAYTRRPGQGAVTYVTLGHCHNPAIRAARPSIDPNDVTPAISHGAWGSDAFTRLLRNALAWDAEP